MPKINVNQAATIAAGLVLFALVTMAASKIQKKVA